MGPGAASATVLPKTSACMHVPHHYRRARFQSSFTSAEEAVVQLDVLQGGQRSLHWTLKILKDALMSIHSHLHLLIDWSCS